jgi:hypothetical protein
MSHYLAHDEEYRSLLYGDDYREYLVARSKSADHYRFGRTRGKRARVYARNALRHVTGYFTTMVEAIASSKLRRMERDLELRGIRRGRPNHNRIANSRPAERSR